MSTPPTAPLDINGRRITNRDLQKAMRISILASSLGMVWVMMALGMPLTMFMEAIGASGVLIGLIVTVRLLAMTVQIPAALLSENLGSRKKFWGPLALIHRALWFAPAALALLWKPGALWLPMVVIAVVGLSDALGNAGAASWFSWMTDLIPGKTAGRFWGVRQSIITAASLGGMALAGWILDIYRDPHTGRTAMLGFAIVFGLAAILGMSDILVHLFVKEPQPAPAQRHAAVFSRILAPLRDRDFRHLTLAMGVWNFGCALIGPFGIVYLKRDFQVSYSELAVLSIAGALGSVATSYIFGHLIDRLGARLLAGMLLLLAPVTAFAWFFINGSPVSIGGFQTPQAIVVTTISSFFGGSLFSAVGLCQMRLLGQLSGATGRTMSMALHWSMIGLIGALGPLVGGVIMDWFGAFPIHIMLPGGTSFAFFHAQILVFLVVVWGIGLPLMLSVRVPGTEMPFGSAVSQMLLSNPLQMVRNLYNIQVISAHTTSHRRALAARQLGANHSSLAVPDLAEKMDDPSMEVQEESIEALGTIATAEAVDALLKKLDDPECDYAPQICRALRHARNPRAVDALLRQLAASDRETLCEAARALGAIGERRAIPHLLNLIKATRDNKVIAASSEALASLGELSAAYQIIPQMRALSNRTLKRALAVAAGDLLGERETFYKLLIAETETHGSDASLLLENLARVVRKAFPKAIRQQETIEQLEAAYNDGKIALCADMLLHLGLHLVQFIHRMPIVLDPNEVMQNLLERDRRAAIGIWYLKILNETWDVDGADQRESADVLLGFHIVAAVMSSHKPTSDEVGAGEAI